MTEDDVDYTDVYMSNLGGKIARTDHTFKVCKSIRGAEHDQLFLAAYSVMNEYCQILGQWFTQTKAEAELRDSLCAMAERFKRPELQVSNVTCSVCCHRGCTCCDLCGMYIASFART
jgi:hypothetical protein